MIQDAICAVIDGRALSATQMESAMEAILTGRADAAQIAALVVALRMRGETAEELAAAARVMRRHCRTVELAEPGEVLLDTCGTGGDGLGTFNISTVAAIVVASCGVKVAKHGNRAVSSRAGSADVLAALGIAIDAEPAVVRQCVDQARIGFLFAPAHHSALQHAAPVRRSLGVRTFFNLLGPLSNPAGATHQLVGVYDRARVRSMAEVLGLLGTERAWVVHGEGGLDEVSPAGSTWVAECERGRVREFTLSPGDFGVPQGSVEELGGGDAPANAQIAREILAGQAGPHRNAVVLNAAAALSVAGAEKDIRAAAARAREAIDSGSAARVLDAWVRIAPAGA